jgi:hypothetical protein
MTTVSGEIVNKVANSNLVTVDLDKVIGPFEIIPFDIKEFLYMELMLKEKEYREHLESINWSQYQHKVVAVFCSTDAILAPWAFTLVVAKLQGTAIDVYQATPEQANILHVQRRLDAHNWEQYAEKRVILKGCNDRSIPSSAYTIASTKLVGLVDRLMYGEACSFVPIWRK